MIDLDGLNYGQGWINDPDEVQRIVAIDDVHPVSDYIGYKATGETVTDLTTYLQKAFGDGYPLNQGSCGSCVAVAAALAVDTLVAMQFVNRGAVPTGRVDPMTIYWGSRVEIGGGRIWGQGSVGVWACKWLKDYGTLEQKAYPGIDLSKYSASVCCGPNASRGVPDQLEPIARQRPVKTYAQVKSFDDAVRAIESGYPVTVASNYGFTRGRDAQGFARPSGTWNHQMAALGVRHDRPGVLIVNSWGPYYTGGPAGMSAAAKWVDANVFDAMARQNDTWALSDLSGWAPKQLDFARLDF